MVQKFQAINEMIAAEILTELKITRSYPFVKTKSDHEQTSESCA